MYFESMQALMSMSGHGAYVWTCYGLFFMVLLVNVVNARAHHKKLLRQLRNHAQRRVAKVSCDK